MIGSFAEDIKQIENRSMDYLHYFTLLWGTFIFFIISEHKQHELIGNAIKKLLESFDLKNLTSVDSLTIGLFLMLISFTLFCLYMFIIMSLPNRAESVSEGWFVKKKESNLKFMTYFAVTLTPMYVFYFAYLLALSNDQFKDMARLFTIILVTCYFIVNMFITPVLVIMKRKSTFLKEACAVVVLSPTIFLFLITPPDNSLSANHK